MRTFKGGLIGCGFFSQHHLDAWRRIANVQIVAASDPDIERAQAAAARAYSSAEEMLKTEELDFVDIVARSSTHLELISRAVEKKLAVICQKPVAPDWRTACRIVEIAATSRTLVMIHENWRWQPWYRAAHQMIAHGDIGNPIGYTFRSRRKDGSGPEPYPLQSYFRELRRFLIDEALVHQIDTARDLFGDITSIYAEALTRNPRILGEDHVVLTLKHLNNVIGVVDGHRFLDHDMDGPALDEASFEGELGRIRITPQGEIWRGLQKAWTPDGVHRYRGDSVYAAQAHFVDCLENGKPCESDVREYTDKTFAVVEAAYQSISTGRKVDVAEVLTSSRSSPLLQAFHSRT